MARITMNEIIHAAVRRDLARMEAALRDFPDGDAGRARALQRAWDWLWEMLHHHHEGEDAHIWPYLRSLDVVDPGLADAMEAEHEAMAAAMAAATTAVHLLATRPAAEAAASAADRVGEAAQVTLTHLEHEEREVMPIVVERMETPEWKAIEKQLRVGSVTEGGRFFAWLQDGIEPEFERALRTNVPGPVLWGLSRIAGRSYHREVAPAWR